MYRIVCAVTVLVAVGVFSGNLLARELSDGPLWYILCEILAAAVFLGVLGLLVFLAALVSWRFGVQKEEFEYRFYRRTEDSRYHLLAGLIIVFLTAALFGEEHLLSQIAISYFWAATFGVVTGYALLLLLSSAGALHGLRTRGNAS